MLNLRKEKDFSSENYSILNVEIFRRAALSQNVWLEQTKDEQLNYENVNFNDKNISPTL